MASEACPGCGGEFPALSGPQHPYMESSPGCWAAYGEVLARQYSNAAYASVLQLTVDAYAAQHPGHPSPQSIQSVGRHLISLCLTLETHASSDRVIAMMQNGERLKRSLIWLEPPWPRGQITVATLIGIDEPERHVETARRWAGEVWQAWSPYHTTIRKWTNDLGL